MKPNRNNNKPTRKKEDVFKNKPTRKKEGVPKNNHSRKREDTSDNKDSLLIKGRHEVIQSLKAGQKIESIFLSDSVKGKFPFDLKDIARQKNVLVKEMGSETFKKKFGEDAQGVAAIAGAFSYCTLEEIIKISEKGAGILVALNKVEDPRNLGAIVRTVEASGCDGIILPKHRSAGMTEWAIRTAQGAAASLPVARVTNITDAIEELKQKDFWSVGLDGDATEKYSEILYNEKIVLVAGGEDAGLGNRLAKVCDNVVAIPLGGKTPSLNVSVSVSIVLFEILRQKNFFKKV